MNIAKSTNKHFYRVRHSVKTISNTLAVFLSQTMAISIACFSSASFATQGTDYIEPAKYQTMDKYNVNVAGNQLSPSVETVAIGGALGLKHSITLMGNYFDLSHGFNGYIDKYAGGLRFTHLGTTQLPGCPDVPAGGGDATVMRASFLGQHADFSVVKNDGTCLYGYYGGTDYHYVAVGDKRHTLERTKDGLVWTQPDGTQVFLAVGDMTNSATAHTNFAAQKIVYPNGFTIEAGSFTRVSTNTGFVLKYYFDSTDPGLDALKQNPDPAIPAGSNVPAVSPDFLAANPKCIRAINTAIEAYNLSEATPCSTINKWPKATFTWPGGMPRAMFIGSSTFSVTNAADVRTDFIYLAQDAGVPQNPSIPPNTAGKLMSPRLVEIKSAGATASTAFYTYQNDNPTIITADSRNVDSNIAQSNTPKYDDGKTLPGILTSASGVLGFQGYSVGDLREYHGKSYRSGSDIAVSQYTTSPVGIFEKIDDLKGDRVINFELSYRNFVTTETSFSAPQKEYYYDDVRGNLYKVTQGPATVTASYPPTCSNRKTCNKPTSVIDPNHNQTDYTYHELSGQVETVTLPADKNGKRAQTRYEYSPLQATYSSASGTTTGSPIYLKTAEKYCMNGNFIGTGNGNSVFTGACELGANDEVVTRYEYDTTKNLHLKGKTVTAVNTAGVKTVKRTCYQYDIYNNLIGETQPNANLASCN